jgi:hypothetical protein
VFLTFADNPVFSGNSILSFIVNLKTILPEWVSVGFSAATGVKTELHTLLSWSFSSSLEAGNTPPNNIGHGDGKNKMGMVIGIAVSLGLVSCALGLLWSICWRKRVGRNTEDFGDDGSIEDEFEKGTGPRKFTYRELLRATNEFIEEGKLGEGGFGGVYKGLLSESNTEVAIKMVSKRSKQGKKEYISEVNIISRLRHRNLVQLIGWCHEKMSYFLCTSTCLMEALILIYLEKRLR